MPSEHLCSHGPHLILSGPSLCEPDRVYPLKKDNHLVPGSQSKESRPETVWGREIPGPVPRDVLEVVVSPSPGWDNTNYVPVSTIEQFDRYPFSRRAVGLNSGMHGLFLYTSAVLSSIAWLHLAAFFITQRTCVPGFSFQTTFLSN